MGVKCGMGIAIQTGKLPHLGAEDRGCEQGKEWGLSTHSFAKNANEWGTPSLPRPPASTSTTDNPLIKRAPITALTHGQ